MSDRDKDELGASKQADLGCKVAISRVLEKARDSGLRPDGSDDKALLAHISQVRR